MKAFVMEASFKRFTILNRFVFFLFRKIKNYNTYYLSWKCWPKPATSADIIMVFHNPNLSSPQMTYAHFVQIYTIRVL